MCFSARQTVGGVRWIIYEGCNAYTGHGAVNTEGLNPTEWDAVANSRAKITAQEAQELCNLDVQCQGFTYDVAKMIYWKVTNVDPSGFRKGVKAKGFTVYVKEDAAKSNAARRRREHVLKQMAAVSERYTGTEKWVCYENYNAFTGFGAINTEGATAEEWDSAARSRPPTTLAEAKSQCDLDPECEGFTYDPINLCYWKLKELNPNGFRKALSHEYHVYVKELAAKLAHARAEEENKAKRAMQAQAAAVQAAQAALFPAMLACGFGKGEKGGFKGGWDSWSGEGCKGGWLGKDGFDGKGKGGWDSWVPPPGGPSVDSLPPAPGAGIGVPVSTPQPAPSAVPSDMSSGSIEKEAQLKNVPKEESEASKFNNKGEIKSAPAIKTKSDTKGENDGAKKSFRKKPRRSPEITECTISLHGPGFTIGREDVVLDACQELAFIEGFLWPDYAFVVNVTLCHVEWPSPEVASTFVNATGGTLWIDEKSFKVKPAKVERTGKDESASLADGDGGAITEGTRVKIQKLTGAKELNGKLAIVRNFNESTGRFIVELEEDAGVQKSLKPDNLQSLGPAFEAMRPKAAPKKPIVALPVGAKVIIQNLSGKDLFEIGAMDLNGTVAIIKNFDKDIERYSVELEDQPGLVYSKIKHDNLSPVDPELEARKKKAIGGFGRNTADVNKAVEGVNGDMWSNFLNIFGNEPDPKRQKPEE